MENLVLGYLCFPSWLKGGWFPIDPHPPGLGQPECLHTLEQMALTTFGMNETFLMPHCSFYGTNGGIQRQPAESHGKLPGPYPVLHARQSPILHVPQKINGH
ncbi:MAG TPA: hypothetical protein PKN11_02435 [Anaerolineaceae bacterium]|nr:hypothetical protein [Anaerolineaceae bacterium]